MPELSAGTYSELDASNNQAAPNGMPEGMAPSGVNDAWRAGMGAVKRAYDRDHAGTWCVVGGTENAIMLTYPVAPPAYVQGEKYAFKATAANTGATTVAVNALGAKNVFKKSNTGAATACTGGEIQAGDIVELEYDGTQFQLLGGAAAPFNGGTITTPLAVNDPSSTDAPLLTVQKSGSTAFASDDTALLNMVSAAAPNDAVKLRFSSSGVINDFGIAKSTGNQVLKVNITGTPRTAQTWFGSGGVNIGAPTGGDKGNGSLNIAGGLYLNGAQIQAPQVAKAWGIFEGTAGAGLASFNVRSVSKVGTGQYEITLSTPFSASFAVVGSFQASTGAHSNQLTTMRAYPISASVVGVDIFRSDALGYLDPAYFSIVAFGN